MSQRAWLARAQLGELRSQTGLRHLKRGSLPGRGNSQVAAGIAHTSAAT